MSAPAPPDGQASALKSLGEQLSDPALRSSVRILILVSLAINGKLGFLDLLQLTGMGKGSLSNHIEKLEAAGYVATKRTLVWGGHRVVVEITGKGLGAYDAYVNAMKVIGGSKRQQTPLEDPPSRVASSQPQMNQSVPTVERASYVTVVTTGTVSVTQ